MVRVLTCVQILDLHAKNTCHDEFVNVQLLIRMIPKGPSLAQFPFPMNGPSSPISLSTFIPPPITCSPGTALSEFHGSGIEFYRLGLLLGLPRKTEPWDLWGPFDRDLRDFALLPLLDDKALDLDERDLDLDKLSPLGWRLLVDELADFADLKRYL